MTADWVVKVMFVVGDGEGPAVGEAQRQRP
jgi:hypothetical protein